MPIPNPVFLLVPYRFSTGINSGSIFSQLPVNGTGDFTYIRPGSASFIGSNGNIQFTTSHSARILNYYSGSGTCPALLVEPSAQNAFIESQTLFTTHFVQNLTTTGYTNAETSPDGSVTAEKFVPTASGVHGIANGSSLEIASGTTYTLSLFVKSDGGPYNLISLTFDSSTAWGATRNCIFNASNGTNFSVPTGATMTSENYGNGWYRIRATLTAVGNVAAAPFQYRIYVADASGGLSWMAPSGNTNGIFCWGAQLEASPVATSYIPTTTAAVTRNADIATDTSYTFPLPNGTIYTEHFASRTSSYYAHSVGPIPITTGSNRIAVTYTPSKIAVYKNGSFLMSQSMGTYEVGGSIINLGHSSGSYQLNDNLLAFAVYNSELTPADAISLTSGSL